jgi:hypothetical protein
MVSIRAVEVDKVFVTAIEAALFFIITRGIGGKDVDMSVGSEL